ncbi:hypothetical protein HUJ05_007122 [Dendroctonus ponderosae]|nr:hypothetical protein HUJ05_007122 [Dendroctonus ponderosae]
MRKMRLLISCLLLGLANAGEYSERFLTLYNQIVDSNNGYYSSHGVPYHSLENMLVETVDHGHETDSEAISNIKKWSSLCRLPFADYVYFETSSTFPYQIRRIEELNKTPSGNVEAKVMCFYRRRDLPSQLIQLADKHQCK